MSWGTECFLVEAADDFDAGVRAGRANRRHLVRIEAQLGHAWHAGARGMKCRSQGGGGRALQAQHFQ
jgi:hypothetical protein